MGTESKEKEVEWIGVEWAGVNNFFLIVYIFIFIDIFFVL